MKHLLFTAAIIALLFSCNPVGEKGKEGSAASEYNDDYTLPAFFDEARVHAHTRMALNWMRKDSVRFYSLADSFGELGVRVFSRHIKSGAEGAWWPSKLGKTVPEVENINIAKVIIDNAHENGQKIIAYHRHMEDNYFAKQHPDWICRMPDGEVMTKRGVRVCFNTPYADAFLERALELVELGVDGFYFDEQHQPKIGCWCEHCRRKFKEETGLDVPEKIDLDDPLYKKFMDYKNLVIERTFLRYREEFHSRNPELVMLIGSNSWPSMADWHTTNRLWRFADIQKTEFHLPIKAARSKAHPFRFPDKMHPYSDGIKMAHGWTLARDATGGRPPHIWVHLLLNEPSSLFATSALIGHGCIANLDHREQYVPNQMFKSSYELGNKVSPYLAGSRPLRWMALHYSEHARDQYIGNGYKAWKQVLYPHLGAYMAMAEKRLPVGMITDSQLEDKMLDGYEILFVTDRQNLTQEMEEAINDFHDKGGHVIYNDTTWMWHEETGQQDAINTFIEEVYETELIPPVQVTGGPDAMQVDQFFNKAKNRLVVACMNDFSWVWTGFTRDIEKNDPDRYREILERKPPGSCKGVKVILRGDLGVGPVTVIEAVSGNSLEFETLDDGISIEVPDFEHLALIVVKYQDN